MTIGQKITRLRKEDNLTQEQLADILHVSRQSVSKWESDLSYPETEKLIQLSKLFNCSIDYLLNNGMEKKDISTYGINKKNNIINRAGIPLAITTISVSFLCFIIYFFSTISLPVSFGLILYFNYYDICFSSINIFNNNITYIFYMSTFILTIIVFILGWIYLFCHKKTICFLVKLFTSLMVGCYCASLCTTINPSGQFYAFAIVLFIYAIVMLIIKPFRFKIDKEIIK